MPKIAQLPQPTTIPLKKVNLDESLLLDKELLSKLLSSGFINKTFYLKLAILVQCKGDLKALVGDEFDGAAFCKKWTVICDGYQYIPTISDALKTLAFLFEKGFLEDKKIRESGGFIQLKLFEDDEEG